MQSTSCEMSDWVNHKLESRLPGEKSIIIFKYVDDTTVMAESEEELQSLLMRVKEESENWPKIQHSKMKIMASGPIISWQIDGENFETVTDFNITDHNEG